jgi:anti-anti-sigma regulatory factor
MDCGAEKPEQVLTLEGDCTLERARELKSLLHDALKADGDLVLNLDNITATDISFLQLICAAHRTALAGGKRVLFRPKPSTAFMDTARGAGFLRTMGCQNTPNMQCLFMEVMKNG